MHNPRLHRVTLGCLVSALVAAASSLLAAAPQAPNVPGPTTSAQATAADFTIKDFRFTSGETLPEVRMHYYTLGTPRRDASGRVRNAVLLLHGTGGTGRQFLSKTFSEAMFAPGRPLDAQRYFIVLPDNIGHGASSKPSDALRSRFPKYGYNDMVTAQYRLLTEGLKLDHLRLVMGTSMGGMHTWMWGEMYPRFMDGLVPLASVPTQIAGRNRMWRKMILDSIRTDPGWNGGDYTTQPRGLEGAVRILVLMAGSTVQSQKEAPTRDAADEYLLAQMKSRGASVDANDMLYYFDASRDYDPSAALDRIEAPLLAINFADDLINPPELGLMERLMPRVKQGHYVLLPITPESRGHGSHSWPDLWLAHFTPWFARLAER